MFSNVHGAVWSIGNTHIEKTLGTKALSHIELGAMLRQYSQRKRVNVES